METGLLISLPILTAVIAVATFYYARKKETKIEAKMLAIVQNDLEHIKEMLTSLIKDFKSLSDQFTTSSIQIARLDEEIKLLEKRVSNLEEEIK